MCDLSSFKPPPFVFLSLHPVHYTEAIKTSYSPSAGTAYVLYEDVKVGGSATGSDWSTRVNHNTIACTSTGHVPLIGRVHLHISCTVLTNQSCCRAGLLIALYVTGAGGESAGQREPRVQVHHAQLQPREVVHHSRRQQVGLRNWLSLVDTL